MLEFIRGITGDIEQAWSPAEVTETIEPECDAYGVPIVGEYDRFIPEKDPFEGANLRSSLILNGYFVWQSPTISAELSAATSGKR